MSFSGAHQALAYTAQSIWREPPAWFGYALAGSGVIAGIWDYVAMRRANRPLPPFNQHKVSAQYYGEKAEELRARQQALSSPVPPSRYLMEEGNADIKTDCFSCASGHLAAMEGALTQAAKSAEDGACGEECAKWLTIATEEPAALLARDWTPEKVKLFPVEQQEVVGRYAPKVRQVMSAVLEGPAKTQRENLVEAAALLGESVRFAQAGDGLDHPEVDWRLSRVETLLTTAERASATAFQPEVAQELRHLRQTVGSKINSPEDLAQAADHARRVSWNANQEVFSTLSTDKIVDLLEQAKGIRREFRADRVKKEAM